MSYVDHTSVPEYGVDVDSECVVRLHAYRGLAVVVEHTDRGQSAWCIVEIDGTHAVLDLPPALYTPFVRAGAVAGESYRITRNRRARSRVFSVRHRPAGHNNEKEKERCYSSKEST